MTNLDEFFGPSKAHAAAQEPPSTSPRLSPQAIKTRGEQWTRNYMKNLCGIYVKKRSDAAVVLPDGREYTPKGLDLYGSVVGPESPFAWKVEVEVKTFRDSFALAALKKHQVDMLYEARQRGELAMVSLVEHDNGQVLRMWWVLWPYEAGQETFSAYSENVGPMTIPTFSWITARLREKAEEDKRFHAKSIRQVDLPMLDKFLVAKSGRSWQLSETHWMRALFNIPTKQRRLL